MAKLDGKVNLLHPLTSTNPKLQRIKRSVFIHLFSNSWKSFQNRRLKSNQFLEDPNITQIRSATPKTYFFSQSNPIADSQHGWVELNFSQVLGKYSVIPFYGPNLIQAGTRIDVVSIVLNKQTCSLCLLRYNTPYTPKLII